MSDVPFESEENQNPALLVGSEPVKPDSENSSEPTAPREVQEQSSALRDRLREEKEFDLELSNIMDGKKRKISETGEVSFVDDPELKALSLDERRLQVIDRKSESLLEQFRDQYGDGVATQKTEEALDQMYGKARDEIRQRLEKQKTDEGKDISSPTVQEEIERETNSQAQEAMRKTKKTVLEKVYGSVEAAGEVVNANFDFETFVMLICGQAVGEGRYGAGIGEEGERKAVNISELYKFLANKKRHLSAAFQICGVGGIENSWGDGNDPSDPQLIEDTLEKQIYPDGKKSILFIKTFLISVGRTKEAYALSDPDEAQQMIQELKRAIQLKTFST